MLAQARRSRSIYTSPRLTPRARHHVDLGSRHPRWRCRSGAHRGGLGCWPNRRGPADDLASRSDLGPGSCSLRQRGHLDGVLVHRCARFPQRHAAHDQPGDPSGRPPSRLSRRERRLHHRCPGRAPRLDVRACPRAWPCLWLGTCGILEMPNPPLAGTACREPS